MIPSLPNSCNNTMIVPKARMLGCDSIKNYRFTEQLHIIYSMTLRADNWVQSFLPHENFGTKNLVKIQHTNVLQICYRKKKKPFTCMLLVSGKFTPIET